MPLLFIPYQHTRGSYHRIDREHDQTSQSTMLMTMTTITLTTMTMLPD